MSASVERVLSARQPYLQPAGPRMVEDGITRSLVQATILRLVHFGMSPNVTDLRAAETLLTSARVYAESEPKRPEGTP